MGNVTMVRLVALAEATNFISRKIRQIIRIEEGTDDLSRIQRWLDLQSVWVAEMIDRLGSEN
jgi:hypothetical protein